MAKVGARSSRWSLSGMTALVTGGTRGIGRAIVEELAEVGATVYTLSRNEAELNEVLQEWASRGFKVSGSVCDVSCREERTQLLEKVSSAVSGKLNILVNNVGTYMKKPTSEITADEYNLLMSTNLDSSYHFCQLAYLLLKDSEVGNIVFISSVAGLVNINYSSAYAATKAAINQLTKNMACEWAKDNIRVNCVAPWYIRTPLVEDQPSVKEFMEKVESITPIGRIGEPEEVSSLHLQWAFPSLHLQCSQNSCPSTVAHHSWVGIHGKNPLNI